MMACHCVLFSSQCAHLSRLACLCLEQRSDESNEQHIKRVWTWAWINICLYLQKDFCVYFVIWEKEERDQTRTTQTFPAARNRGHFNACRFSSQEFFLIAFMLPAQLETLPGNLSAQKFQSLFLVVCVMCIEGQTEAPKGLDGFFFRQRRKLNLKQSFCCL